MIRLRPYRDPDAGAILSWIRSEREYYQWSAGVLGTYPPTEEQLEKLSALMRFTALDGKEPAGFFTLRNPKETLDEVRFGFVLVDPGKRGRGIGSEMLRLGLRFAKDVYRAEKASLGVFENNEAAYRCYRAVGFRDMVLPEAEAYDVMGERWTCRELGIALGSRGAEDDEAL